VSGRFDFRLRNVGLDAQELANSSDAIDAAVAPRVSTVERTFAVEREDGVIEASLR
jgi:hypothetical protein